MGEICLWCWWGFFFFTSISTSSLYFNSKILLAENIFLQQGWILKDHVTKYVIYHFAIKINTKRKWRVNNIFLPCVRVNVYKIHPKGGKNLSSVAYRYQKMSERCQCHSTRNWQSLIPVVASVHSQCLLFYGQAITAVSKSPWLNRLLESVRGGLSRDLRRPSSSQN